LSFGPNHRHHDLEEFVGDIIDDQLFWFALLGLSKEVGTELLIVSTDRKSRQEQQFAQRSWVMPRWPVISVRLYFLATSSTRPVSLRRSILAPLIVAAPTES
jgi:hypothetical protein